MKDAERCYIKGDCILNFDMIRQKEEQYVMQTYGRFPAALVGGHGVTAVDAEGREYLDLTSGIGVNALGYCNDRWLAAVVDQAGRLQHASNLYYTEPMVNLAEMLCRKTGMAKVFFGNSGAEANECAIKLARKYGSDRHGQDHTEIISLVNSFHGRTITTLAATGQDVFHQYFWPFTEGFSYAEPDMESVRAAVSDRTCAVMIECVQGEGGVLPLDEQFVRDLASFCREQDLLLIIDEIQTGMGRTGKLFAFEHYGITPDIFTSSKALGGGLPIGACLCSSRLENTLGKGMHGSTFGGNPVSCAAACAVLEIVSDPAFLSDVTEKGAYLRKRLEDLPGVREVRGLGMMLGFETEGDRTAAQIAAACLEQGLLVLTAKTAVRLLPPLVITREEIDRGLSIIEKVLLQK